MDALIIDLANSTTLLHEKIAEDVFLDIGIIYFNKKKFQRSKIKNKFYINLTEKKEAGCETFKLYEKIESFSDVKLSRALYLDRYISNKDLLNLYYNNFIYEFSKIVDDYAPTIVLGELSLGWELLAYGYCEAIGIQYLLPLNIYSFSKPRLAFFGPTHSIEHMEKVAHFNNERGISIDNNDIYGLVMKRKRVDINSGFGDKINKTLNANLLKRLKYNVEYLDTKDYRDSVVAKGTRKLLSIVKKKRNSIFLNKNGVESMDAPYYLFMLHVQPEVTPDTTATFFNNQYEVIRQIALRLPFGEFIYVKEHPNGIGCRNFKFYKDIAALPNVKFLSPALEASTAIKNSIGVFTIGGNGSLEAALYGKKAAVFNDIYFSSLSAITKLKVFPDIDNFLKTEGCGLSKLSSLSIEDENLFSVFYNGSFDCYWHQPMLMDGVLSDANISNIKEAISTMVKIYDKEPIQ